MAQPSFDHLFSPIYIGKVQLKNRMAKTAAQTYLFDSGDRRFGPLREGLLRDVAKGGVGLIIVETPAMEWPLADEGDRRLRVDNDKYLKDIEDLAKTIHAGGIPCFMQFYHRGPWGGIYHNIARRVAASPVTFPSVFDVHEEEPPEQLSRRRHPGVGGALRRLGRPRWPTAASTASRSTRAPTTCSTPSCPASGTGATTSTGRRTGRTAPASSARSSRRCASARDRTSPIQVFMNGIEFGVGDLGLSLEENKQLAQIWRAVRRRFPARALALGGHAPGLVPQRHPLLSRAAHPR